MSRAAAAFLLAAGVLVLAAWMGGVLVFSFRGVPRGETVLARTRLSAFQAVGGACCAAVFSALWVKELFSYATGESQAVDLTVLLWSVLLSLVGMAVFWMAVVRQVWCTGAALVQRSWRGEVFTAPWPELAGAEAVYSFDDVVIPWGEKKLTLDSSMPGFDEVEGYMAKRGVDLSAKPPKRLSFFKKNKDKNDDPFSGRK